MLSLYCGVTDAVSAKIERQAGIVTYARGKRYIDAVLDQSSCTVLKRGK